MKHPEPQVCEAFARIADLAIHLGVTNINLLPGCWEHQIDAKWWIAMNGHKEPIKTSEGDIVHPFNAFIKYNGWPAGVVDPGGGVIAAGSGANEDTFIEALMKATK